MTDRPNTLWPKGAEVRFLDAYGKNPRRCRVLKHINEFDLLVEDERGIRHLGKTWRVADEPPAPVADMFEDLLG